MNQVLPKGWSDTKLGSIVDYGKAVKKTLSDVKTDSWILELEDIEKKSSKLLKFVTASERPFKSTKNTFKKGDVLYGKLRPYLNKVIVAIEDGVCTTEIIPINSEPFCLNKYMFYWLKCSKFLDYVDEVSYGVNMPRLGTSDGKSAPFRLAPLAEQKEIVAQLDKLLAQVESTKARLDAIPAILKRFRQSVLAAAVSGKLTEEWRGDNCSNEDVVSGILFDVDEKNNSIKGWEWRKLVDVSRLESGHTPRKSVSEYWDEGNVPWISLQDIRLAHGAIISKTKYMPTEQGIANSSARLLPEGTVCFCRDISVGYTTVMGKEMSTTQHFANWVCGEEINNMYLLYCFMASKDHLTRSGQGTTVKTIYMPALKEMQVLLPSLEEQSQIVRRIEELFSYADKVEAQVNAAQQRVNSLTQSILAKAFSGEITAKWREQNPDLITGENSAAALLEKIKGERAALVKKKKPTKKNSSRKTVTK